MSFLLWIDGQLLGQSWDQIDDPIGRSERKRPDAIRNHVCCRALA
jgi:hypothetical protein